MSIAWEGYKPAPIEVFHGEALEKFHELKKLEHGEMFGEKPGTVDGITFNKILAEFKVKVMKEYGISSDAIPLTTTNGEGE